MWRFWSSQESREQELETHMEEARWSCLHGAVEEAQKMIQDALAQIDDPVHISCTSSAGKELHNAALSCSH